MNIAAWNSRCLFVSFSRPFCRKRSKILAILTSFHSFIAFVLRMSFSEFTSKASKDPRFKLIEKAREREGMYNEFMIDYRKNQKQRIKALSNKVSIAFIFMNGPALIELCGREKNVCATCTSVYLL